MKNNRILFIDETSSDTTVAQGLIKTGYILAKCHNSTDKLHAKLLACTADLLVLCVQEPTDSLLAELHTLHEKKPLPIVLFVENPDVRWINKALDAGVSSYIYKGLEPIRIPAILAMAQLRFAQVETLKQQLQCAQDKLKSRVLVDRAKGMLMEYQKISEQQAYRALQKTAMDQATTIADIARQTISVLSSLPSKAIPSVAR